MPESDINQEKEKPPSDSKTTNDDEDTDPEASTAPARFPPDEEATLLGESNDKKSQANALFTQAKYENAINKYEEAASICPHYLDYELAVLKSNVAVCHLKLEQYKEAIKSATESLEGLSRVEKAEFGESDSDNKENKEEKEKEKKETKNEGKEDEEEDEAEEEIVSSGAQKSAPAMKEQTPAEIARQKRHDDILRIRAKALMRRARARSELGGWSDLSGAEEDYKLLAKMTNLTDADARIVRTQLRLLPPRVKAAQDKEMSEMWGKLKDLGNGILRPFGLSTENFNMVKDEKTGGYSMNFSQNSPGQS